MFLKYLMCVLFVSTEDRCDFLKVSLDFINSSRVMEDKGCFSKMFLWKINNF